MRIRERKWRCKKIYLREYKGKMLALFLCHISLFRKGKVELVEIGVVLQQP